MKRGQWLPVIEDLTQPSEQWPFEILPRPTGRLPNRRAKSGVGSGPRKEVLALHVCVRRGHKEHSSDDDIITGKYLDTSSEDYLVLYHQSLHTKWKEESTMQVSERVSYVPWEEIVFISLRVESERPA